MELQPETQRNSLKKKAAAAVSVVLALALGLGGTYMWRDYSQHKTNQAMGEIPAYDVRLVEDFEEVSSWKTSDPALTKEIRVANVGKATHGFSGVYVRLQLKEYMEIAPITYTQTANRYMINEKDNDDGNINAGADGKFVIYDTEAEAKAAYPGHGVAELTDAVTGQTGWFVQTQAHDPDGQYGKFVVTEIRLGDAESLVDGVERADHDADERHQIKENGECLYTVHTWNGEPDGSRYDGTEMFPDLADAGTLTFHDFVEWIHVENSANLMSLTSFVANGSFPIAKWIYDDRSMAAGGTNWVYWGKPLEPQNEDEDNPGSTTSNLLDEIKLLLQPQGNFYYAIHADMEALSLDELAGTNRTWNDAPEEIINSYINNAASIRLTQLRGTIEIGEIAPRAELVTVTTTPNMAAITWSSSDDGIATVNAYGDVTGIADGTVTITATLPTGEKASYTLNVVGPDWHTAENHDPANAQIVDASLPQNRISAAKAGDTADWIAIAKQTVDEQDYYLIVRTQVIGDSIFDSDMPYNTDYKSDDCDLRLEMDTWWSGVDEASALKTYAAYHNALEMLGEDYRHGYNLGFLGYLGFSSPAAYGSFNGAFPLSADEAAEYMSKYWCYAPGAYDVEKCNTSDGTETGAPLTPYTNWEALKDETSVTSWLRSSVSDSNYVTMLSNGHVTFCTVSISNGVRPALWVRADIFK
jgi:hypothetical protein